MNSESRSTFHWNESSTPVTSQISTSDSRTESVRTTKQRRDWDDRSGNRTRNSKSEKSRKSQRNQTYGGYTETDTSTVASNKYYTGSNTVSLSRSYRSETDFSTTVRSGVSYMV